MTMAARPPNHAVLRGYVYDFIRKNMHLGQLSRKQCRFSVEKQGSVPLQKYLEWVKSTMYEVEEEVYNEFMAELGSGASVAGGDMGKAVSRRGKGTDGAKSAGTQGSSGKKAAGAKDGTKSGAEKKAAATEKRKLAAARKKAAADKKREHANMDERGIDFDTRLTDEQIEKLRPEEQTAMSLDVAKHMSRNRERRGGYTLRTLCDGRVTNWAALSDCRICLGMHGIVVLDDRAEHWWYWLHFVCGQMRLACIHVLCIYKVAAKNTPPCAVRHVA